RALWRRSAGWELAAIAWIPAAYFTFRAAVLADFRPLSRFVLVAAALSLPFAWSALAALPSRLRTAAAGLAGPFLVGTPAALARFRRPGRAQPAHPRRLALPGQAALGARRRGRQRRGGRVRRPQPPLLPRAAVRLRDGLSALRCAFSGPLGLTRACGGSTRSGTCARCARGRRSRGRTRACGRSARR